MMRRRRWMRGKCGGWKNRQRLLKSKERCNKDISKYFRPVPSPSVLETHQR